MYQIYLGEVNCSKWNFIMISATDMNPSCIEILNNENHPSYHTIAMSSWKIDGQIHGKTIDHHPKVKSVQNPFLIPLNSGWFFFKESPFLDYCNPQYESIYESIYFNMMGSF